MIVKRSIVINHCFPYYGGLWLQINDPYGGLWVKQFAIHNGGTYPSIVGKTMVYNQAS